jgi:hypothetical protein
VTGRLAGNRRGVVAIGLASALAALMTMAAARLLGPTTVLGLIAAAGVGLLLLSHARVALLLAVVGLVLAESNPEWGIGITADLYTRTPSSLNVWELLALLAAAAVVLDVRRRGEPLRAARPFGAVLLLATAAVVFGLVNCHFNGGGGSDVRSVLHTLAPLFVLPFVIVNAVRTPRDLHGALAVGAGTAIVKAVVGLGVLAAGLSQRLSADGPHMTYYEATANFLLMTVLFGITAAALSGVRLPRWVLWSVPLIVGCLLLSYRRVFWIATVLGLVAIALIASGRVGRRMAVPLAVLLTASVWLIAQAPVIGELSGPVVQRGATINASKVKSNTQDRYRIAERRNVVTDLETHPLTGAGIGVGWQQTYPLPFEYETGRHYVHFAILWWWLNMGVLGAITYVCLMLSAAIIGWQVWRRHPDDVIRSAGLAMGAGVLGVALVELTASFIGPDPRMATLLGVMIGLLAAAYAQLPRAAADRTEARIAR